MVNKIIYTDIFLPVIAYIGLVTSYEDFKTSKIRNKWVFIGLLYALLVYLLSWILHGLAGKEILGPIFGNISSYLVWNFDKWCVNLVISVIVAYVLWHYKMWGGGDAKLFICYSALIPMGQYSLVYFKYYFASFLLLIMIFIPASIFLFLRSCIFFIKRAESGVSWKYMPKLALERLTEFNAAAAGKILFGFFVFFLFFSVLRQGFTSLSGRFFPRQVILAAVSLLMFTPLSKIFKKSIKLIFAVFILLVAYLIYTKGRLVPGIVNSLLRAASIMIIFPLFRKITDLYIERTTKKTTPFAIWVFLGVLLTWFWRF